MISPKLLIYNALIGEEVEPTTVIFWNNPGVLTSDVSQAIREHSEQAIPVSKILALTWKPCQGSLDHLLENWSELRIREPGSVSHAVFGEDLTWKLGNGVSKDAIEDALNKGYQEIFLRRGGILVAREGFHYAKPSGAHAKKFLRAANVLVYGTEISFFAMELARRFPNSQLRNNKCIYTDTAAINSVAFSLDEILREFGYVEFGSVISSFGSYKGLEAGFEFENVQNSICIMSATTSGHLEGRLVKEKRFKKEQIITLFAANNVPQCDVLFNTSVLNDEPFGEIKNFDGDNCELCMRQEPYIQIAGDQFLPENPKTRAFEITETSLSQLSRKLINGIVGKGVAVCNGSIREKRFPVVFGMYRDANSLSKIEEEILDRFVRMFPRAASTVLVAGGACPALASLISDKLPGVTLTDDPNTLATADTKFIFAPVTYGGSDVISSSLRLRDFTRPHQRSFLIGLSVFENGERQKEFRSNISFGRFKDDYTVDQPYIVHLPLSKGLARTVWQIESDYWENTRDTLPDNLQELVDNRVATISEGDAGHSSALRNGVFLPSLSGESLQLTPGFAFWTNKTVLGSHADVYLTMAATLQDVRNEAVWRRSEHSLEVLEPAMFFRFSDSAIQAALLRSTEPSEMNYGNSVQLSESFFRVLEYLIERRTKPEGFAVTEFGYAILNQRVRLDGGYRTLSLRLLADRLDTDTSLWSKVLSHLAQRELDKL